MPSANRTATAWKRSLLAVIAIQVVLLIVSLPGQRIHGDEAAFAEVAYWQSVEGHPRSELLGGLLGYEDRILLCHKLFETLGALMIAVFGFGIWPVRTLSLVATVVIIVLLWRYFRGARSDAHEDADPALAFLIATGFLLLAPLTFKFAKFFRPEMMQAAMGLGSFMLLSRGIRDAKIAPIVWGGVLVGAAVLTHLNGVVYAIAGFALLLFRGRVKLAVVFGVSAGVVSALFFYDIIGRWDVFWWQYVDDPTFGEHERTVLGTVMKLIEEHKRLFRKPEIIFSSALFFITLIAGLWPRTRAKRDSRVYVIAAIIALGALAPAKTTPYAILLFPFFAIEIACVGGR